jgi:alpha-1,3-mannosyltransferase
MVRARQYQALVAGITLVLGLWFMLAWFHDLNVLRWNHDAYLDVFDGNLPPVPHYQPDEPPFQSHKIDEQQPQSGGDFDSQSAPPPSPVFALVKPTPLTGSATPTPSHSWYGDWNPAWDDRETWPKLSRPSNSTSSTHSAVLSLPTSHISHSTVKQYIYSIMDFRKNPIYNQISCPSKIGSRYKLLRGGAAHGGQVRYFFALNLHQSQLVLPRLMSSIVEAMRFLGPEHCAISVVEGRSTDGTDDILRALKPQVEAMGARFFLEHSSIDTMNGDRDRIEALAELRNAALAPLKANDGMKNMAGIYSPDAIVIFINDIAMCPEDILELVYQHVNQDSHMTCAFDWIFNGTLFYDVWVSRSLAGNLFFEIPHDGSWTYSQDLFFDDPYSRKRYESLRPLQVYSCWGGMVVLDAAPFVEETVKFRSSRAGECYMGEPTLLAKDLFRRGLGKIMVVPSVNVAYNDDEALGTKAIHGYVADHVNMSRSLMANEEFVEWQLAPPPMVKCLPNFNQPSWVPPT